jgi:FSR family fosmidomycin resistance protein-like MFS transporter
MTSREKSIVVAMSACHALVHAYMLIFPTIYKSLGEGLHLEFARVGLVGMVSYLAFGFGALPAGFLVDRFGARSLVIICLGGTTVASLLTFVAGGGAAVAGALVLLGFFASLYHPAGLAVISMNVKDVGKAIGIHGMAGTLGVAAAPLIAGTMTSKYGWQYSYLFLGAVGAVLLMYVLIAARRGLMRGPLGPREGATAPRTASAWRDLLVFYVIVLIYGLIYRGVMTFFPGYLSERVPFIGGNVGRLGLISSGIMVISIVGPLVGGYIASRSDDIRRSLFGLFGALALLSVGFYFLYGLALVLVVAPTVLLIFCFQPLQNTLIARLSHDRRRGTAYGINFALSFGVGAVAAGLGGVIGEKFGMSSIFIFMLGLCLIEMVIIASTHLVRKRRSP